MTRLKDMLPRPRGRTDDEAERRRSRADLPTVISLIALFVALGGGAYAASVAKKNSVTSKSIKNGQVKSADIGDGQVTGADVDEATLQGVNADNSANLGGSPPAAFRSLYAVVAADGTLQEGRGVAAVARQSAGLYTIRFTESVRNRGALIATARTDNTGPGNAAGNVQISERYCDPAAPAPSGCNFAGFNNAESVGVLTENSSGTNSDEPFVVTVVP